jgi:hypothetical protein
MSKFKGKEMSGQKKYPSGLNNVEKRNSFSVPEGYFENFSFRLQEKLPDKKEAPEFQRSIQVRLAIAASFIGFLVITFAGIKYMLNDQKISNSQTFELADAINYRINDYDDDLLFEFYSETSVNASSEDVISEGKNVDEMLDYLLYTDLDIQLIIKEL